MQVCDMVTAGTCDTRWCVAVTTVSCAEEYLCSKSVAILLSPTTLRASTCRRVTISVVFHNLWKIAKSYSIVETTETMSKASK